METQPIVIIQLRDRRPAWAFALSRCLVASVISSGCGSGSQADPPAADAGGDGTSIPGSGMVPVPGGSFMMGCNAAIDTECGADELPQHAVNVSSFEIDRTEVTYGALRNCVAGGGCAAPSNLDQYAPTEPVAWISWAGAQLYCQWANKRLPTEAEWEKAARGTDGRKYPWGNEAPDCTRANMSGCAGKPVAVGTVTGDVGPYGARDMAGNLSEWVGDWYGESYYAMSPMTDPTGPAAGMSRVTRGGSYLSSAKLLRTSSRDALPDASGLVYMGFRCAKAL
jgi:formylglycine-generating enzyme required for sulfatase activity